MPTHRRTGFRTVGEAQAAGAAGIDAVKAKMTADVTAIGITAPAPRPVIKSKVISVEPMPVGAVAGNVPYSRVIWEFVSPDGRVVRSTSILPSADINASTGGTAMLTSVAKPTITVKASVAIAAYVVSGGYDGLPITPGAILEDASTGKKYSATGTTLTGSGGTISIGEVDATDHSEVTLGTPLQFTEAPTSPPLDLRGLVVVVIELASASIPDGTTLTDLVTGLQYSTSGITAIVAAGGFSGDVTKTASFIGGVPGPASVAIGTVLTFDTPVAGVARTAVVASSPTYTVPEGQVLTDALTGQTFETSAAATIGDAASAPVAFIPPAGSVDYHVTGTPTLTVTSPPTGVSPTAAVVEATAGPNYPYEYTPQVFSDELDWGSYVRAEPGGEFSVTIFTLPIGT